MSGMMSGTICHVSDVNAAAVQLGGKFEREDCGFFSKCTHNVEKYDTSVPQGGYVEIMFCELDWTRVVPLLVVLLLVALWVRRKVGELPSMAARSGSSSDEPDVSSLSRRHRHR
jgi:hypothetical protein